MKTVTGRVITAEPISLSKAATLLSGFASSDNGASRDVRAYLRRASDAFTKLKSFHREIKSKETMPSSGARRERNVTGEERKGRKKEKKKKKKKKKTDEEIGTEERKSKKKRKSDEEMGSKERKSKKKRKLKGVDAVRVG